MNTPVHDACDALSTLARDQATGELICAADDAEVHVHLQRGRIAWATTSSSRLTFVRYARRHFDLDSQTLLELVRECQRERKPLVETLVSWGLASHEQARDAVLHQIRDALASLPRGDKFASVFLRRGIGYSTYDSRFSFALEEIHASKPVESEAQVVRHSTLPPNAPPRELLTSLIANEPGLRWIEHHRRGRLLNRVPQEARQVDLDALLDAPTTLAIVRTASEALLGVDLADRAGHIWCGAAPDALLGGVIDSLRRALSCRVASLLDQSGTLSAPRASDGPAIDAAIFLDIMNRSEDLWAVAMHAPGEPACWLSHREGLELGPLAAQIARCSAAIARSKSEPIELAIATPSAWLFGASLTEARHLWIVVNPTAIQGLGWALLGEALASRSGSFVRPTT